VHEFFFENLRNPARIRRAGVMRQFPSGQLDSNLNLNLVGRTWNARTAVLRAEDEPRSIARDRCCFLLKQAAPAHALHMMVCMLHAPNSLSASRRDSMAAAIDARRWKISCHTVRLRINEG
jgi:hypothetical protein